MGQFTAEQQLLEEAQLIEAALDKDLSNFYRLLTHTRTRLHCHCDHHCERCIAMEDKTQAPSFWKSWLLARDLQDDLDSTHELY